MKTRSKRYNHEKSLTAHLCIQARDDGKSGKWPISMLHRRDSKALSTMTSVASVDARLLDPRVSP